MKVLVTGAAGFIGFTVSKRLLERGDTVVGWDNLNDYYDVNLKLARLEQLKAFPKFAFEKIELSDSKAVSRHFEATLPNRVINLAAQAGVRYSLRNPHVYVASNVTGFLNILECCRHLGTEHLVYASTSSVYGANRKLPFSVEDSVNHPVSLYAATKKSNELMAHCYSHLFNVPTTGLRFFTVYGPWGRPDMALFLFTKSILERRPIQLFNNGHHGRDFTYVDDIVDGIIRVLDKPAEKNPEWDGLSPQVGSSNSPYRLYNIGNHRPVQLLDFVDALEKTLGMKAIRELVPMQPGDVEETFADISPLTHDLGFHPRTNVEEGIRHFVKWYRAYYQI